MSDKFNGNNAGLAHSIKKLTELDWPDIEMPPINLWSFPAAWKQPDLTARDVLNAAAQRLVQPDGWAQGVESVAKMIEKKADDYASEYGHDDMGALSFGSGHRGRDMAEYHSNLVELAEDIRKMLPNADEKPQYQSIDWNEISKRGLLVRINREIMHPIGLAVFRDPDTGESGGALVAPDGAWDYPDDQEPVDQHAQLKKFYDVKTNDELIAAQEEHIRKLQAKVAPFYPSQKFPPSPRQG